MVDFGKIVDITCQLGLLLLVGILCLGFLKARWHQTSKQHERERELWTL